MKTRKLLTGAAVLATACFATARVPAENSIGIDVSSANGALSQSDWDIIADNGATFAFARATTGYDFSEDSTYVNNMKRGKKAGLLMGAYEFSHLYADTPEEEATYFWNYAGGQILADGQTLSPMIDFEVFSGYDGASSYTAWFNAWSTDVKAKTSSFMHPAIYADICSGMCDLTTACTLAEWAGSYNGENVLTGNPWNACLSCNYVDPGTTSGWTYWGTGQAITFPGIAENFSLDASVYQKVQLEDKEGVE